MTYMEAKEDPVDGGMEDGESNVVSRLHRVVNELKVVGSRHEESSYRPPKCHTQIQCTITV